MKTRSHFRAFVLVGLLFPPLVVPSPALADCGLVGCLLGGNFDKWHRKVKEKNRHYRAIEEGTSRLPREVAKWVKENPEDALMLAAAAGVGVYICSEGCSVAASIVGGGATVPLFVWDRTEQKVETTTLKRNAADALSEISMPQPSSDYTPFIDQFSSYAVGRTPSAEADVIEGGFATGDSIADLRQFEDLVLSATNAAVKYDELVALFVDAATTTPQDEYNKIIENITINLQKLDGVCDGYCEIRQINDNSYYNYMMMEQYRKYELQRWITKKQRRKR